jgi:hypothetical protein
MKEERASELAVNIYQSTLRYTPEDSILHNHLRENPRSHKISHTMESEMSSSSQEEPHVCSNKYTVSEKKYTHLKPFFFGEKINGAMRVQFSAHETATQEVSSPHFSISLHFYMSSRCCAHNVHPLFKCPVRLIEQVLYGKTSTVLLSQ